MSFLNRLSSPSGTPHEAGLVTAVAALTLDGDLTDLERRIISLFRDQFPPLSAVDDAMFTSTLERAVAMVNQQNVASDIVGFVRGVVAPAITNPQDRLHAYRYVYALAMADLNLNDGEAALLAAMQANLGLVPTACTQAEQEVLNEFRVLHRALAATVLGLVVVTADGRVDDSELENVRQGRALLEPIGRLDDTQFGLVFDLSLNIHDRFLLDPTNRQAFVSNIVTNLLDTQQVRLQAFEYAASIATADGDMAQAEADTLKLILADMQISDAAGEAIFNRYMARIRTIDGKPR